MVLLTWAALGALIVGFGFDMSGGLAIPWLLEGMAGWSSLAEWERLEKFQTGPQGYPDGALRCSWQDLRRVNVEPKVLWIRP